MQDQLERLLGSIGSGSAASGVVGAATAELGAAAVTTAAAAAVAVGASGATAIAAVAVRNAEQEERKHGAPTGIST